MGWKRLSSKVIYDNPWMSVLEDRVINPSGGQNDYGHIRFKTRAVAIIPIDDEGNTWLVGQDRYTLGEYSWEIPMGGAPKSEDALAAAKRELREETGLQAGSWREVLRLHTSNSITDEEGFVYIAKDLQQGETAFEETEQLEIRNLPLQDAVAMVQNGEITDAISVAALLWANQNL
jgi:8-oxo-dGTP pyrophosphatase MutT (NUDIX family)